MEASKSEIQAWEYNSTDENEKLAHKYHPNRAIPLSHVHGLGILTWKLDVDNWESDTELKNIRSDRGYKYSEVITVSREAMVDFDARVKGFFKEHMHSQEESRLILDGSGTKLWKSTESSAKLNNSCFCRILGYQRLRRQMDPLLRPERRPRCSPSRHVPQVHSGHKRLHQGTAAVHGKSCKNTAPAIRRQCSQVTQTCTKSSRTDLPNRFFVFQEAVR
ncbi:1,2-dihydroxy-3-keto-5-methylthiopentene dioxygenase 2 isoform X2 [Selaginella moellendorffii]|uniref:1,2-dihydroxy-3-keto-5-methylthiopentene dioxygenase 2 isoform X2 n=1 Tax=Selaginella moellendorffii TaxID=88036 RepID=UPI000D1C9949|nr:1,2-dihydroxy-3-keto-5-methylthiopentene dioxygenase 2 isoform X2 [Selaginella moellendorffii]|eukprot:XP_024541379.1 1,2-dihydroxy-3-keto-5-methylthiopentene dioxygenase 2 isoform X2 [Selaginella moellendorffii]